MNHVMSQGNENGKIVRLADIQGRANRNLRGPARQIFGKVVSITDIPENDIVAFRVRHGGQETLFWMSTAMQQDDPDYRKPLVGEIVRVWFNEAAKSLDAGGEKALGIVEVQNISNDAEQEAFAWLRKHPDGLPRV